jgi:K+-transporting ATPase c subunit
MRRPRATERALLDVVRTTIDSWQHGPDCRTEPSDDPQLWFFGENTVDVVDLNLAIDKLGR